ncbi:MAG: 4Fe-4S dicluster domain-containing protein [Proteobacteria bacterium]|nr:4Fe-4S dicluster domain-containing protein [Pseudomonadota bacterium]
MLSFSTDKNFTHCHGCGLCTLVCPVWHQTRDIGCTPHGHAKAMQFGGDINADGLFGCVLCGACEPVCPEDIELMSIMIGLRAKVANNSQSMSRDKSGVAGSQNKGNILLLADESLCQQNALLEQTLKLLSSTTAVEQAQDNGSDITLALQFGTTLPANRIDEFIDSIKHASRLIVSNGLLKRVIQQRLPNIKIVSLGYALSSLPGIRNKLGANDLYIIESQAYHADFNSMVTHYDELKRSRGCELNLDLQRLAMPTGGLAHKTNQVSDKTVVCFDASKQGQWILQGLNIERIVVENIDDGIVMKNVSDKPVIHVAELATSE